MTEEQYDHWKCPECDCVQNIKAGGNGTTPEKCDDCGSNQYPADWLVSWEDFWRYCQELKYG
jgi:hypothetical protein